MQLYVHAEYRFYHFHDRVFLDLQTHLEGIEVFGKFFVISTTLLYEGKYLHTMTRTGRVLTYLIFYFAGIISLIIGYFWQGYCNEIAASC